MNHRQSFVSLLKTFWWLEESMLRQKCHSSADFHHASSILANISESTQDRLHCLPSALQFPCQDMRAIARGRQGSLRGKMHRLICFKLQGVSKQSVLMRGGSMQEKACHHRLCQILYSCNRQEWLLACGFGQHAETMILSNAEDYSSSMQTSFFDERPSTCAGTSLWHY